MEQPPLDQDRGSKKEKQLVLNIVEFIVKLRDDSSGPLGELGKNTKAAKYTTDQLTDANKKLKEATGKSAGSISDLKAKIKGLQDMKELLPPGATKHMKAVNEEISKLQKNLSKLEGSKPTGLMGSFKGIADAIPPIFKNPMVLIGAGLTASINQGMKNSQTKLDFELLLGKDSGDNLYQSLKRLKPILGEGIFNFGKDLANSGVAADKVTPMLNNLGEVARGDEQKLAGLTQAFGDLQKEGKLTESVMSQMEAGGFKPLVLLSQQTGQSMATLRRRFDEGKISAKEVGRALEAATKPGGQFYGNLEKIANSPMGGWNTLIEKVKELTSWLGDALMPIVSVVLDYLIGGFEMVAAGVKTVVEWMEPLAKWTKENSDLLGLLASTLGGLVIGIKAVTVAKTLWVAVTGGLTTAVQAMSASIMAIPVIGWILAAIAAIIAAVVYLRNNFEGFGEFFSNLWEQCKASFSLFTINIKQGFEFVMYHLQRAWLKFQDFHQFLTGVFQNIGNAIKLAFQFKFSEAKEALTAKITTKASGEIDALEKEHEKKSEDFEKQKAEQFARIVSHPLAGIIKRKKDESESASDASTDAVGASDKQKQDYLTARDTKSKTTEGINAVSGGGVKNITITVQKMGCDNEFVIQGGTKQAAMDLGRMIREEMVRALASASGQ